MAHGSQEVVALDQQLCAVLGPTWGMHGQQPANNTNRVDPSACRRERHAMATGAWGSCDECNAPAASTLCYPCSAIFSREIKFCYNCLSIPSSGTPHGCADAPTGVEAGMFRYTSADHNVSGMSSSPVEQLAGRGPNTYNSTQPNIGAIQSSQLAVAITNTKV